MNSFIKPVFVPNGVTYEDLVEFTKRTYREFYWRPRTIWSYLRRGRSVSDFVYYAKSALGLARFVYGKEAEVAVARYGAS